MADPIDAVRLAASVPCARPAAAAATQAAAAPASNPLDRAQATIDAARALGADAAQAARSACTRGAAASDVEGILLATRKADAAFRMLEAARNAMLEAYAQVRDLR